MFIAWFNWSGKLTIVKAPNIAEIKIAGCDDLDEYIHSILELEQWEEIKEIDFFLIDKVKTYLSESLEKYKKEYNPALCESEDIETYWENEFFWGKKESFEDIISFITQLWL